jgi:hypothetical protein
LVSFLVVFAKILAGSLSSAGWWWPMCEKGPALVQRRHPACFSLQQLLQKKALWFAGAAVQVVSCGSFCKTVRLFSTAVGIF